MRYTNNNTKIEGSAIWTYTMNIARVRHREDFVDSVAFQVEPNGKLYVSEKLVSELVLNAYSF